jgi:hypothetical protein
MRSAGAAYRERRRRSWQRLQAYLHPVVAGRELEAPPAGASVHVMGQIDQLPKDVRALIYEYGLVAVAQYYNQGSRGALLAGQLTAHRRTMQRQWLNEGC